MPTETNVIDWLTVRVNELKIKCAEQECALADTRAELLRAETSLNAAQNLTPIAPAPRLGAEGRARIVAAQKLRWARVKAAQDAPQVTPQAAPQAALHAARFIVELTDKSRVRPVGVFDPYARKMVKVKGWRQAFYAYVELTKRKHPLSQKMEEQLVRYQRGECIFSPTGAEAYRLMTKIATEHGVCLHIEGVLRDKELKALKAKHEGEKEA